MAKSWVSCFLTHGVGLWTFGRQRLDCTNCSTVQWDVAMTLTNRPRPTLSCKDDQSIRILDLMILTVLLDYCAWGGLKAVIITAQNVSVEQGRNHHAQYDKRHCNNKRKKFTVYRA